MGPRRPIAAVGRQRKHPARASGSTGIYTHGRQDEDRGFGVALRAGLIRSAAPDGRVPLEHMAVRLGELLLREKRVTPAQLQEALNHQRANGGRLGTSLVKLGILADDDITSVAQPPVRRAGDQPQRVRSRPRRRPPDPGRDAPTKYNVIPVGTTGNDADARDDGSDQRLRDGRHQVPHGPAHRAGRRVRHRDSRGDRAATSARRASRRTATSAARPLDLVNRALEDLDLDGARTTTSRSSTDAEEIDAASLERQSGEAPVIRLVNALMLSAIQKGASDIHIEPYEKEMRIRFRIDGVLQPVMTPPLKYRDADHLAHQDHGAARHRREAAAAGRPHQGALQRPRHAPRDRLPRVGAADALRRKGRPPSARSRGRCGST